MSTFSRTQFHLFSLNVYQYQIRPDLFNTMKWYYNHRIIGQLSPDTTTGWHHNFCNAAFTLIKLHITHMPQPLTFSHTDYFFFSKFTIMNQIITSILPFLYYMMLLKKCTKKIPFFFRYLFLSSMLLFSSLYDIK